MDVLVGDTWTGQVFIRMRICEGDDTNDSAEVAFGGRDRGRIGFVGYRRRLWRWEDLWWEADMKVELFSVNYLIRAG